MVWSYVNQDLFQSLAGSKVKAAQVRALLYKLRATWGDRYHVFTDHKLHQLDLKVNKCWIWIEEVKQIWSDRILIQIKFVKAVADLSL